MPTTWQSCRSPSSRARPSQCSTAALEPCTTLLLPTIITITSSTRRPPSHPLPSRWTPSAGQPAPQPCLPLQLPLPPRPPQRPVSAGTSPPPGCRPRARPVPRSWPVVPCPSPARTWPATCVRSSAMLTSIQTRDLLTPCRSSPPRVGARLPAPSAPSVQRGWMEAAAEKGEQRRGGRRRSGSGGLALRSFGRCTSEPRPATSELQHKLIGPR